MVYNFYNKMDIAIIPIPNNVVYNNMENEKRKKENRRITKIFQYENKMIIAMNPCKNSRQSAVQKYYQLNNDIRIVMIK